MTGQALKLMSANPDAILIAASGSGAAMPQKGLVERGYPKGKIYQTHGAATMGLIRIGGAGRDGTVMSSGPAAGAGKLARSDPTRARGPTGSPHRARRAGTTAPSPSRWRESAITPMSSEVKTTS